MPSILRKLLIVPAVVAVLLGVTTAGVSAAPYSVKYTALGDSVAAGLGYGVGTAPGEDLVCGRSSEAYAYKVADRLNAVLPSAKLQVSPQNIACQGATTRNLLLPQLIGGTTIRPQLDKAFEGGDPQLVTLTSGANDVRWATFIGACFSAVQCNTPENTAAAQGYIAAMKIDMKTALQNIRSRSRFIPPVVVATGYYMPVSAQCLNPNFTPAELAWLQQATTDLNTAIRDASQGSYWFARYAAPDFSGHDICAADSWIQRPNEAAPFHPTPRGQQAIADAVVAALGIH